MKRLLSRGVVWASGVLLACGAAAQSSPDPGPTESTTVVTTSPGTVVTTPVTSAVPSYNSATRTLTLPQVLIDGVLWRDVVLRLDAYTLLSVGGIPATVTVVTPTPTVVTPVVTPTAYRTCRLNLSPGGYALLSVWPTRIDWQIVADSNPIYFDPGYFRVQQGTYDAQIAYSNVLSHQFRWTGNGFSAGPIPTGTVMTGSVTWANTWFDPARGFMVYNAFTGVPSVC
jgi:hypothetical protein